MFRGKKYKESAKLIDRAVQYDPNEALDLVLKAASLNGGSGAPNKTKVGTLTAAQVEEIAKTKMPDLNCVSLESAISQVKGTCRSMGVTVVD